MTPNKAYFQSAITCWKEPSPWKMKTKCDKTIMTKATRVMRLGAMVAGTNFSKYSAKGDQRYL